MKKRILGLALALIMIISLLPMTAMAEAPEKVKVTIYHAEKTRIYKTVADGDVAFIASNDDLTVSDWTDTTTEPADKYMKLEYDVESATLKVTLKNFKADMTPAGGATCHGLEFPAGEYAVSMELIGENLLHHGASACIKTNNDGGLSITGTEGSSLTLNMGTSDVLGSATAALWLMKGDLTVKNTALNVAIYTSPTSLHHTFCASGGNVTLEKLTINHKANNGGQLVYMADGKAATREMRYTLDTNADRKVTVKDCKITSDGHSALFASMSPVTLINTELKATTDSAPLFNGQDKTSNPPTIEGEYTAIAGLKKNAEKLDKLKVYDPKKLNSYTYLYIVPGKVDLLPTEETTEATEAPTTEETEAPTTEATTPVDATQPTTSDKTDSTNPTTSDKADSTNPTTSDKTEDKSEDEDDASEEKSGNLVKILLIILVALAVLGGGAVGVFFYLRNKNAGEEDEEEESEEETEE